MKKSRFVTAVIGLALLSAAAVIFLPILGAQDAFFGQNKGGNVSVGTEPPVPTFPEVAVEAEAPVIISKSVDNDLAIVAEPIIMLAPDEDFVEVPLFFATNRTMVDNFEGSDPADQFTDVNGDLLYGHATVTIPRDHQMGVLESQGWFSAILFEPNPKKHVILQDMYIEDKDLVMTAVSDMLGATDNSILLYVHGFNTGLNKATRRAGQLTYDLGWDGPSFLFSWPSQASFLDYFQDSTLAERSYNQMAEVLEDLTDLNPDRVVVIAHSMGTRVLSHGLARLANRNAAAANRITSVILAAPDIDEDVFMNDLAPQFRALTGPHFTLYASAKDSALSISKNANGFPRIGDTTNGIPVIEGFDVIDATTTESNFFEHTYFAESTSILTDVYQMVQIGVDIEARKGTTVVEIKRDDQTHWQINPEPITLPACKARDNDDTAFQRHQAPCDPTLPLE